MSLPDIATLMTALGIGAVLKAAVDYLRDRRRLANDTELQERTMGATVQLADLSTIQQQVAVLNGIITTQRISIESLQRDRLEADERDQRRLLRIRELETEVDRVKQSARDTQDMCDRLSRQLRALTTNEPPTPATTALLDEGCETP